MVSGASGTGILMMEKKRLNFERTIIEWGEHIQALLDTHYVHLLNDRGVWIVSMSGPGDKVHAYPSVPNG